MDWNNLQSIFTFRLLLIVSFPTKHVKSYICPCTFVCVCYKKQDYN